MNKLTVKLVTAISIILPGIAFGAESAPAAAAPSTNSAGPKIQFATPQYDFGKARAGDPVKYTYVFTNTGDATLMVSNVQPSCGCTTAGEWSRETAPGKTGTIPVQFNSANYSGNVFKTITVTCNDKEQHTVVLQLKGSVWKPIDVQPQFAMLNVPPDAEAPVSTVVKVVNNMDTPLQVWDPESNNKAFTAQLKTNTPGKEYEVTIATVPPLDAGNVQGQITLKSSSNSPVQAITAWANVQQAVTISPPMLTLPSGPLSAKQSFDITIQNNSATRTMALSDPAIEAKDVEVQLAEPQPGKSFKATLTFPQGFDLEQTNKLEFTVKSSNPKFPVIKVPVSQAPRAMSPQPAIIPISPVPGHAAIPAPPTAIR